MAKRDFLATGTLALSLLLHGTIFAQEGIPVSPAEPRDAQAMDRIAEESPLARQALRLQKRLHIRFGISPPLYHLADALQERRNLLKHSVTIDLAADDGAHSFWIVSASAYPDWIRFIPNRGKPVFRIAKEQVQTWLTHSSPEGIVPPSHAILREAHNDDGVLRATIEGQPRDGYAIDAGVLASLIEQAFAKGESDMMYGMKFEKGSVIVAVGDTMKPLELLSMGQSNFEGSGFGRKANVRKALHEKVHGVVVPSGNTFSFNDVITENGTLGGGWADAFIIVNGKDLVTAPGGGICQAATTVYRAALHAGLPILKRANHSLYVSYYKAYGVGLDATIFPGSQDLTFTNDTAAPIVILSWTDGDEARVAFYGVPDGRSVDLQGPYFASSNNTPRLNDRSLGGNEIAWKRSVRYSDGTMVEEVVRSRYLGLPRSLAAEYDEASKDLVAQNQ